jgi:hypothetical protein
MANIYVHAPKHDDQDPRESLRLVGALFTASILLMNVGTVLAGSGGGTSGP